MNTGRPRGPLGPVQGEPLKRAANSADSDVAPPAQAEDTPTTAQNAAGDCGGRLPGRDSEGVKHREKFRDRNHGHIMWIFIPVVKPFYPLFYPR